MVTIASSSKQYTLCEYHFLGFLTDLLCMFSSIDLWNGESLFMSNSVEVIKSKAQNICQMLSVFNQ